MDFSLILLAMLLCVVAVVLFLVALVALFKPPDVWDGKLRLPKKWIK